MAEKQCNLLKNGGGTDKIMLRVTITNSGSQTRGALIQQLYTPIMNAINEDISVLTRITVIVYYINNNDRTVFNDLNYMPLNNAVGLSGIQSTAVGDVYLNQLLATSSSGKFYYSYATSSVGMSKVNEASNNTDIEKIELYF